MNETENIPNIELATPKVRASEHRYSKGDFEDLGQEDSRGVMYRLYNILICNTALEKDETFNAGLEYRHQHTLQSLLDFVNSEEKSAEFGDDPILREINSSRILTNVYPILAEHRPDSAKKIIDCMCEKINKETELHCDWDMFEKKPKLTKDVERTFEIIDFFKCVSLGVNNQPEEATIQTFETLLSNIHKTNYTSFSRFEEILVDYFRITAKENNKDLFKKLTTSLFNFADSLDPTLDTNYMYFEAVTGIYNSLLNISKEIPSRIYLHLNKQIFDRSYKIVRDSNNLDKIREQNLRTLWNMVSKGRPWAHDPEILNQEIDFHIKTLDIAESTIEEKTPDDDYHKNGLIHLAYDTLGSLLEQYSQGASGRDENWVQISQKHHTKFAEALNLYLRGINSKDQMIKDRVFRLLNNIINIEELSNPTHPFYKEGNLFYFNYFSDKVKSS